MLECGFAEKEIPPVLEESANGNPVVGGELVYGKPAPAILLAPAGGERCNAVWRDPGGSSKPMFVSVYTYLTPLQSSAAGQLYVKQEIITSEIYSREAQRNVGAYRVRWTIERFFLGNFT